MMFLFPTNSRRFRLYRREIVHLCSFQDENEFFFLPEIYEVLFGVKCDGHHVGTAVYSDKGLITNQCQFPRVLLRWIKIPRSIQLKKDVLSKGTITHGCNLFLATLIFVWFLSCHQTSSSISHLASLSSRSWSIWCIYLSQLCLIYENGVTAMGRYIGEGKLLRVLNKNRFVLHAMAMPLLAIPVTEIAMRQSIYDVNTQTRICVFLSGWSVIDLTKWNAFHHSHDFRLVDNRESKVNKGPYLPGTLAYTSDAFWEIVLPPVLLVLYEFLVGSAILAKPAFSFEICDTTLDQSLDLAPSPSARISTSWPPMSAVYLILSAVLTLCTSGMAYGLPEIQLLGENLHGILLWAAFMEK